MKARGTLYCTSLDQTIVPITMVAPERTFINCLPSNDLEMWFQGTIFCEMDELNQTPPEQTLLYLQAIQKYMGQTQSNVSQTTFHTLKLKSKTSIHNYLFI
jgi:hypothetical protein